MVRRLVNRASVGVALALLATGASATAQLVRNDGPSDYLQCDGYPNNVTAGEATARFIGAVTLLALFAPPQEQANSGARLLGTDGVKACSRLLDDDPTDTKEGANETNVNRRVMLLMGRAIHQIEAANYDAALADVVLARTEAEAAGLMNDPYFRRSTGRGMALIEAQAQFRKRDIDSARRIGLGGVGDCRFSLYCLLGYVPFSEFSKTRSSEEDVYHASLSGLLVGMLNVQADRLEETGEFTESALQREDMLGLDELIKADVRTTIHMARASLGQALASNWERSNQLADQAQNNLAARTREGSPDPTSAQSVELLDLQRVLRAMQEGRAEEARRLFTARSAWPTANFGSLMETVRRLRVGAPASELTGPLAKTPEQMWADREESTLAGIIDRDRNNRSLWYALRTPIPTSVYEGLSRQVWRVDNSRFVGPEDQAGWSTITLPASGYNAVSFDAMLLHAALVARQRQKEGFVLLIALGNTNGVVRFGSPEDRGMGRARFIRAAEVIAELEQIIPSPDVLRARRNTRR